MEIRTIVLFGAGKVASVLGPALKENGLEVVQIYNRSPEAGIKLAGLLKTEFVADISLIRADADLYLFCLSDDSIAEVARRLKKFEGIAAHTSGTVPSTVFSQNFNQFGVFYPLQTFGRKETMDLKKVPFCIAGNNQEVKNNLFTLAAYFSDNVSFVSDKEREYLHVSAVFANNFTNHMLSLSKYILNEQGLSMNLLMPLIRETFKKWDEEGMAAQTGPAMRGDKKTISRHFDLLSDEPALQDLYEVVSGHIVKWYTQRPTKGNNE